MGLRTWLGLKRSMEDRRRICAEGIVPAEGQIPAHPTFRHYIHLRRLNRTAENAFSGRQRVAEVGDAIGVRIPKAFGEWTHPEAIRFDDLPASFVLKPTFLSSTRGVLVLQRTNEGSFRNLMKGGEVVTAAEIVAKYAALKAGWETKRRSSNFSVKAEEMIVGENGSGRIPFDYKIYVVDGKSRFILQVDRNVTPPAQSFFINAFELFDYSTRLKTPWKTVQRGDPVIPRCASALVVAAEAAADYLRTPMISVDLYASTDGPVLGELTWAPGGIYRGRQYKPKAEFDAELGRHWFNAINRLGQPHPAFSAWSDKDLYTPRSVEDARLRI